MQYEYHDLLAEFKYRSHESTPLNEENDTLREIDDFNPTFELKMLFDKGERLSKCWGSKTILREICCGRRTCLPKVTTP